MTAKIDILLATYNGAKHIRQMLDTLTSQTVTSWRLITRDDVSSDDTAAIISQWAQETGVKLLVVENNGEKLGASGNFARLLEVSDAPYFAFCDQDDFWLPEKLEILQTHIEKREAAVGGDVPVLAHSDLTVVNDALEQSHASFWRMSRFLPEHPKAHQKLMVQNVVTGCATMGNAAIRSLALPIPEAAVMHDWWLALVAGHMGELINIKTPTILYRQHVGNVVGAKTWSIVGIIRRFFDSPSDAVFRSRRIVRKTTRQASAFADRFEGQLDRETQETFATYGMILTSSLWKRKTYLIRKGIWPDYWPRAILQWVFM